MKRLALVIVPCALLLAVLMAVSAQSQDDNSGGGGGKKVVFSVGDPQGIDSMNPLIGVTVAAYEAWNIQYATLTDKAASDFHTIPGLAESWKGSKDGLTWTYKLRPGLKWSDGKPLTAEDIAWNVNTSRDEEWINHSATTVNLDATAKDDTTVVIKSKVPDPKLPTMDVYILPKHIWGKMSADARGKYAATDGVGSGPFVLDKFEKGQFARFKANKYYWGGKPAVDEVVLRKFNNPDTMVAALKTGEIDAAEDIPGAAFDQLAKDDSIQTVEGNQGAMSEIAINGGDGLKKPHPALLDPRVRQAIAHAIDKKTLVARVLNGHGTPADTLSTSPDPKWTPDIPADQLYDFDLDKAKQILEDAGYKDTDGDGVREMPGGGKPLNFTYMVRSDGETGAEDRRVRDRLAEGDRDRDDQEGRRRHPAHRDHRQGRLRHVLVGLDPVRGPRPDAVVLHVRPDRERSQGPDELLQRRQLLRPAVRQALPEAEGRARPRRSASRSSTRCSRASSSRRSTT